MFCLCLNHTHRIFCRISNNFDCPSALQVDTASMPRPSLAANESHFRCFASCTSSKISYGMRICLRKCLRNFLYSLLESRCSSSAFWALDHLEKFDRGWNHRLGNHRHPRSLTSSTSPCILYTMSFSTSKIRAHSVKVLAWRRFSRVKNTTKVAASAALRHTSWSSNAMRSTDVWCGCSKCSVPRTALSPLVGARREVVYSY